MKQKRSDMIQLAILAALGAAVILTLFLPQLSSMQRQPRPMELSVIIRESDSSLWANARTGMEQAAGELGAELRFLTLSKANDGAEQGELLLREIEQGTDALIVAPADPDRLEGQLESLDKKIPVVAVESHLSGAKLNLVLEDEAIGAELARAVLEDGGSRAVLLVNTAPGCPAVSRRLAAAWKELEAAGRTVQACALSVEQLEGGLAGLARRLEADRIMTFEPAAAEAALRAKQTGELEAQLYGVGATAGMVAGLDRGLLSAVVAWSDYAAGYLAVERAVQAANGEEPQLDPLPIFLIRGEEIYEPDYQKLLFPVTS